MLGWHRLVVNMVDNVPDLTSPSQSDPGWVSSFVECSVKKKNSFQYMWFHTYKWQYSTCRSQLHGWDAEYNSTWHSVRHYLFLALPCTSYIMYCTWCHYVYQGLWHVPIILCGQITHHISRSISNIHCMCTNISVFIDKNENGNIYIKHTRPQRIYIVHVISLKYIFALFQFRTILNEFLRTKCCRATHKT